MQRFRKSPFPFKLQVVQTKIMCVHKGTALSVNIHIIMPVKSLSLVQVLVQHISQVFNTACVFIKS